MGVVYHAEFLVYFEVARTEYLRALGSSYRDLENEGFRLVVVEARCSYRDRAAYDDALRIRTRVDRLRPTRIDFVHRVTRQEDDTLVAEGRVVLACTDADGRPRRLPPRITKPLHRDADG